MKIIMHAEDALEFRDFHEPGMDIETRDDDMQYSALQMFATSLAICTFSVLHAYGEQSDIDAHDIQMQVRWGYSGEPRRIDGIQMDIHWPQLPQSRIDAAQRAASKCPIHETLANPPRVDTKVSSE